MKDYERWWFQRETRDHCRNDLLVESMYHHTHVIADVQFPMASGHLRPTDKMLDLQDLARPVTLTVRMEQLCKDGLEGVLPGSKCIANAYTNNHELIASGQLSTPEFLFYHMVDTVGFVHALLLRIQTLLLPVKTLVFSGH